jgi:BNR repeat-like domain
MMTAYQIRFDSFVMRSVLQRAPVKLFVIIAFRLALWASTALADEETRRNETEAMGTPVPLLASGLPDLGLQPPALLTEFGPNHVQSSRGSQGVPSIERSPKGRLWSAWYASKGSRGVESPHSYCVLATSGDDGVTWTEKLVLQAAYRAHTYDPCLWIDPTGRLWLFWAQSAGLQDGRMGVWSIVAPDSEESNPTWSPPKRISNGVMLNKPTVLNNGNWLLPVGYWRDSDNVPNISLSSEVLAPSSE